MTNLELEEYAKTGALPAWFKATVDATADYRRMDQNNGQ
jgi:hypothetical protein